MVCKTCARRHYKCDNRLPQCGRCKAAGRTCTRDKTIRFRHAVKSGSTQDSFPDSQIWIALPPKVDFINISEEVQFDVSWSEGETNSRPRRRILSTNGLHLAASVNSAPPIFATMADDSPMSAVDETSQVVTLTETTPIRSSTVSGKDGPDFVVSQQIPSQIYLDPPGWPLDNAQEAVLFHHFINKVAPLFDLCDQDRHFAIIVPHRARVCRTLFNAIMAVSARHACQTTNITLPLYLADHYQTECFKTLIPVLSDSEAVLDETLLATIVILRLLEELEVGLGVSDSQKHLLGGQSLVKLQANRGLGFGLKQASFWACLRQDIYTSLKYQQPTYSNLEYYSGGANSLHELVDDGSIWSNYAALFCAEVLQYSFGDKPRSKYLELMDRMEQWRQYRPASYEPFYHFELQQDENNGESGIVDFPTIKYTADWHVMAAQFFTLGRTLLVAHDVSIPRVGLRSRAKREAVEEQVKREVRSICGVALSNPDTGGAILIASLAISVCGEFFEERVEQEKLHALLIQTEEQYGWPTNSVQEQLRHCWGW